MDVVIIEDERLSADKLIRMIGQYDPQIEVVASLDSVKKGVNWFRENSPPDLVFLDIQLSDGTAFDLLNQINQSPPIIFTTAYDQYAIKAFKFNSIDYLLKPLEQDGLQQALDKFKRTDQVETPSQQSFGKVDQLINGEFKKRFLIKVGDQYQSIEVTNAAYFMYDDGLTYLFDKEGNKWPMDQSLDHLENMLHPLEFFRINRKFLISLGAISQIHSYFNSRLLLKLKHETNEEVIVSRDRVGDFKRWMDI